jgi:CARDB
MVVVAACHPSDDVSQRFATFAGQMQAVKGTARMAMHFTLLERLNAPDFTAVGLTELRPWRRSKKGASSFIYTQRVTALRDGGTYRMRVQFRWYGSDGKVMKTKTMRSGACHQPAPLPNLQISSITGSPGALQGTEAYVITVANTGSGDAGAVTVALKVDGGVATTGQIPVVAAGKTATLKLSGPTCTSVVRAIADPRDAIDETNEKDNSLLTVCPSA